MADGPDTEYIQTPDGVHIGYQIAGNGAIDLVPLISTQSNVDAEWLFPPLARLLTRLGSFSRLIRFDFRGTGSSDRINAEDWTIEKFTTDLLSVLDAAHSERAALLANNLTGTVVIRFAAMYPERVSALILDGCFARFTRDDGYMVGLPQAVLDKALARMEGMTQGGQLDAGLGVETLAPSHLGDAEFTDGFSRLSRSGASPSTARQAAVQFIQADVRALLADIVVPTLVLCRADDAFAGPRHGRYLAEQIAGAAYVELPGTDNLTWVGDIDAVVGEIEEFLTGARHRQELDRVLTTILFTDIVGSTVRAATVGDRKWRELLDGHDEICRQEIEAFRGQFVKSTGDGIVATFDGPTRAIRCAQAITTRNAATGLDVRSGVHTGEVEHRADDLHGLAVHVAQRVCSLADGGEVLTSATVVELVSGSDITFADHGTHALKGVPGTWRISLVAS